MKTNERRRHCNIAMEHLSMVVIDVFEEAVDQEGEDVELKPGDIRARAGLPGRKGYDFLFSATLIRLQREGVTARAQREDKRDFWRLVSEDRC